ncbi:MAG: HD-GYP domain-containing protein [Armatimonadetes bacterium]|nr:HD-GYP domain-containing protein [Armatimonadota bacterium]
MEGFSRREVTWYACCFGGGLWVWLEAVRQADWSSGTLMTAGAFLLVTFLSLFRRIRLSSEDYHSVYTLDDVAILALLFLQGWTVAAVVAGLGRLAYEIYRLIRALQTHPDRVTAAHAAYHFADVPLLIVTTAATGIAYECLNQGSPLLGSTVNLLAIAAAAAVWFPVAFATNAINVTLRRGDSPRAALELMLGNLAGVRSQGLMVVPLGILLALFLQETSPAALLLAVPVALMHSALEARHKLVCEAQSTIGALAQYLEERDPYTMGHSRRVAAYAAATAVEMGLPPAEVDLIRRAGLIHDIGKIDIPDAILHKPGVLTDAEREIMSTHTDRAISLSRKLVALRRDLPFNVAAYHHEHFDGSGHFRLRGDQIPMASRILAVADAYDAMTSNRPYRSGISPEDALLRIHRSRGSQLDPRVVTAFTRAFYRGTISARESALIAVST